jgi:hypothetical protein
MNGKKDVLLWGVLLALLHAWISFFLFRRVLVICSDSDFYLSMARAPGFPRAADRPMGLSLVLRLLFTLSDAFGSGRAVAAAMFMHSVAVLGLASCAAVLVHGLTNLRARIAVLAVLGVALFSPIVLLFHSAVFMPDSLTLTLSLVGLAAYLSSRNAFCLAAAAATLGVLCTVRSGQFLYSGILVFSIAHKLYSLRGKFVAALAAFAAVVAPAAYHLTTQTGPTYIGGRSVMAHLLPRLDCDRVQRLAEGEKEKSAVAALCRPADFVLPERKIAWNPESLLNRIDTYLGSDRETANQRYSAWASRAMFLFPGAVLQSGWENLRASVSDPVSLNFKLIQAPTFSPTCSNFPGILWGEAIGRYVSEQQFFQQVNSALLSFFDEATARSAAIWNIGAFLVLLWPFLPGAGWAVYRHSAGARVAHALACAACAVFLFGCYYYSRHMLFFGQLSYFQFAVFLREHFRNPEEKLNVNSR